MHLSEGLTEPVLAVEWAWETCTLGSMDTALEQILWNMHTDTHAHGPRADIVKPYSDCSFGWWVVGLWIFQVPFPDISAAKLCFLSKGGFAGSLKLESTVSAASS